MDSSEDFIAQIIKDDAWKIGPAMVLLHWLVVRRMQHPTQSEHRHQQVSPHPSRDRTPHKVYYNLTKLLAAHT